MLFDDIWYIFNIYVFAIKWLIGTKTYNNHSMFFSKQFFTKYTHEEWYLSIFTHIMHQWIYIINSNISEIFMNYYC